MKLTTSANLIATSIVVSIVGVLFASIALGSVYVFVFEGEFIFSSTIFVVFSFLSIIFLVSSYNAIRDYIYYREPISIDREAIFDQRIMYFPIPFEQIVAMKAIHSRFGVIGIAIETAIEVETKQTAFRLACWSLLYVRARNRAIVSLIGLKPSASEIVSFLDEISKSRGIPFDKRSKLEKQLRNLSSNQG